MATKYISYYPNTLEGQALLDNFVRTRRILRYRDNDRIVEHIKRGMPLYEVESLEKRGTNEMHNLMMHGECLSTCAYLKEQCVEVIWFISTRPLQAEPIMPRKSISAAIRLCKRQ